MLLPARAHRPAHIKIRALYSTESSCKVLAVECEILGSVCDVGCMGTERDVWDGLRIKDKVLKVEGGSDEKSEQESEAAVGWGMGAVDRGSDGGCVSLAGHAVNPRFRYLMLCCNRLSCRGYAPLTIHWSMPSGLWTVP